MKQTALNSRVAVRIQPTFPFQAVYPAATPTDTIFGPFQIFLVLAHIALALFLIRVPEAVTFHAWITVIVAIMVCLRSPRVEPLVYMAAYVIGAEVLWRMKGTNIFWETSKYLLSVMFMIGLVRFRSAKITLKPLLYFAFLIPSTLVTFYNMTAAQTKIAISFNLSGPLCFTICALFFSRIWLTEKDLKKILFWILVPVATICTSTIYATLTATSLEFTTESNYITSAGFGPNQVSAALGLAGLCCYLLYITGTRQKAPLTKILLIVGWLIFTLEAAMTYSRGGIYMEIGAALAASYFLFKQRGVRMGLIALVAILLIAGSFIVLPYLDEFTKGTFSKRFTDPSPTNREVLLMDDLRAMADHPLFGVGPGRSYDFRSVGPLSAHTEYSRLLGEHGLFGLFALCLLLFMLYDRWRQMDEGKPLLVACMLWGMLFLTVIATRLAAPSFMMAIPFATILSAGNSSGHKEQPPLKVS